MVIDELEVGTAEDDKLTVTMRGDATTLVRVLAQGIGEQALIQVKDALDVEMAKRATDRS